MRVVWSQLTVEAPVTGYIIHYTNTDSSGSDDMIAGISAGSTSTDIIGLTDGDTYTISVEATSEHLSGESEEMIAKRGRLTLLCDNGSHYHIYSANSTGCYGDG